MTAAILAVTFEFLENQDFWINVGVLATTYGVFALGVQLNIGTTGIFNFGFIAMVIYVIAGPDGKAARTAQPAGLPVGA